ncbi:Rab1a [Hexamita inflata]|uniref:Rab1a n=1 Tax=Hexamita inflata TaxID=28002 RepID=A0AA86UGW6_9EUKA|nr:Rab1a [Hexamita inflata]
MEQNILNIQNDDQITIQQIIMLQKQYNNNLEEAELLQQLKSGYFLTQLCNIIQHNAIIYNELDPLENFPQIYEFLEEIGVLPEDLFDLDNIDSQTWDNEFLHKILRIIIILLSQTSLTQTDIIYTYRKLKIPQKLVKIPSIESASASPQLHLDNYQTPTYNTKPVLRTAVIQPIIEFKPFSEKQMVLRYKVAFAGDSGVGKTSLFNLLQNKTADLKATVCVSQAVLKFSFNSFSYLLNMFDTSGMEQYKSLTQQYFRAVDVVFLLFDSHSAQSFKNMTNWYKLAYNQNVKKFVVIANKSDLEGEMIDFEPVKQFCSGIQAELFVISSKTGENVNKIFDIKWPISEQTEVIQEKKREKGCCK